MRSEFISIRAAGNSPLHYAVTAGKAEVADFLLGKGVWVEGSNAVDDSVLHIAARWNFSPPTPRQLCPTLSKT